MKSEPTILPPAGGSGLSSGSHSQCPAAARQDITLDSILVSHPDLHALASDWLAKVAAHRSEHGLFGKVQSAIITTAEATELYLTEETTFKAAKGRPDPLRAALDWLGVQDQRRRSKRVTGTGRLEFDQRDGQIMTARVVEVTVISRAHVDAARG